MQSDARTCRAGRCSGAGTELKRFWLAVAGGVFWSVIASAEAASLPLPQTIAAPLARLGIPQSAASFVVMGAGDSGSVLSVNPDQPMNPASTMKLVTTYAALELLGPAFTWKTHASVDSLPKDGRLEGNLYIKGAGDPDLVLERLWLFLGQLQARGIREIDGDVVIDRSLYATLDDDPGLFDGEPYRPYNVAPDAFLLNFKSIDLAFVPDEARHTVRVVAEPAITGQDIGDVRYLDGACGDWKAKLNADFTNPAHLTFVGGFPGACGERHLPVSLYSAPAYAAALIRTLWLERGGTLVGSVREGMAPAGSTGILDYESPTLSEVIREINKYSNNVMAKELFLDLSAEILGTPASFEKSGQVVASLLANRGLNASDVVLENGSGLSRKERISAGTMAQLLQLAWASPLMPEFVASLPLVGVDGTMRRRLTGNRVAGQAHIKTGSLADARAVAGFLRTASGKVYVVVSFINHPSAGSAQVVQDAFLQWVYDRG